MAYRPGTEIARREVLHGLPWLECPVTVMADDGDVLAVLLEPGSPFTFHEHPFGPHPWSAHEAWGATTVLQLHRAGDAYGVWKFFDAEGFRHWYVNFEAPVVRHEECFDTDDHGLDLIVDPDGRRTWKDVADLSAMITSGRMTGEEILGVLHTAAEVSALLDRDDRWWAQWDEWTPPIG
ncbi:DUF402 domain-containing protein [Nocardioides agariphilus]|uniref:DUF402 domain-containing protein n=1 Tax=Nocardioides agariphilus TaxID=433664 RepID=A0A930VP98_9ACTN|nr:DUF402 domain-containing protein [Nocardioides agariphilus]